MKRYIRNIREQKSSGFVDPYKGQALSNEGVAQFQYDPTLQTIKEVCFTDKTIQALYGYHHHPVTKKLSLSRDDKEKKVRIFIYVDEEGKIMNDKFDFKNNLISQIPFGKCQEALNFKVKYEAIEKEVETNKAYTKEFPGGGAVGKTHEAVDMATLKPDMFQPKQFYIYKENKFEESYGNPIEYYKALADRVGYTLVNPQVTYPDNIDLANELLSTQTKLSKVVYVDLNKFKEQFPNDTFKDPNVWSKTPISTKNKRVECVKVIKKLHQAFVKPNDAILHKSLGLENDIKITNAKKMACTCKSLKGFLGGVFGVKDEIQDLETAGLAQKNKFGLLNFCPSVATESKDVILKNIVREHLIRLSESNKKKILDESKIAKKRFNVIIENNSVKTKKQKNKLTTEVIKEIRVLNDMGFSQRSINEGLFDSIGSIFGSAGEGILEMIKENFAEWIIKTLTPIDPNGWLGTLIKVSFGNLPVSDLGKLTDCGFLTSYLAKDIVETIGAKGQSKMELEGGFYDFFRNAIFDSMDKSELGQKIQGGLSNMLCGKLPSIQSKMDDVQAKFKEGALQAATK